MSEDKCCSNGHNYQFLGVVYSSGECCPGSGAQYRVYKDKFFCTKCLDVKCINQRILGNTYSKPLEGTLPK